MKIDVHTHILPRDWPSITGVDLRIKHFHQPDERGFAASMMWKNGNLFRRVKRNCFDPEAVLSECNEFGVDVAVMCTVPVMFNYHLEPTLGAEWTRFLNDDLARTVNSSNRLVGLGSLPMQNTDEAVKELKRAAALGLRGFQIGSHINAYDSREGVKNVMLSDESLRPIWEAAKSLNVGIFVHPWDMEWCDKKYWLPWLVGMPAEVSLAVCSIMLGGVLDRVPDLKIMFAHGGGAFPGTVGRVEWGYKCRPDIVAMDSKMAPREYLADRRIYVDSITHDVKMLENLVNLVGANRIAMGSDYPFPLGEVPSVAPVTNEVLDVYPGQMIEDAEFLSAVDREMLLSGTALDFLGLNRHDVGRVPGGDEGIKKRKLSTM